MTDEVRAEVKRVLEDYFGNNLDKFVIVELTSTIYECFIKTFEDADFDGIPFYDLDEYLDDHGCCVRFLVSTKFEGSNL